MFELFPPPLGTRIADRYELLAPLRGEGPVSTFLVEDAQTGKRCAVSLFDPEVVNPGAWAEFARLVAAAAGAPGVRLPPSVPLTPPEPPYVVEEPPEHRGLDGLLAQEGRIPWQRAVAIGARLAGVLDGVVAATGVAHRCLTPSRCMINAHDEVELLDYGVAEIELAGELSDEPAYRAPEQRESNGGVLSDVFALATIVHELIAGTTPSGPSTLGNAPPAVGQLLARALAPDPEQRPGSLADFRAALMEAATSPREAPSGVRPSAELQRVMPASNPPGASSPEARAPVREDRRAVSPAAPARPPPGAASRQPGALEPLTAMPSRRPLLASAATSLDERTELLPRSSPPQDSTLVLPGPDDSSTGRQPRTLEPLAAMSSRRPLLASAVTSLDERTELLPSSSPPQDSTLVLPGPDDSSTESPGASKFVPSRGAALAGRSSPVPAVERYVGSQDTLEDRTLLLGKRSRISTPPQERTEVWPSQTARDDSPAIERTKKIAASPVRDDGVDERTEVFSRTTPGPKPSDAPVSTKGAPRSSGASAEEHTLVVPSQRRATARTEPTSRPRAPSVVVTASAHTPVSAEDERPDEPRPLSGSPERAMKAVLVAGCLGLATLIGLGLWVLW